MPAAPLTCLIGRDYADTLTGVAFNAVPGDNTATVAWALYDSTDALIGGGTGSYVSAGSYAYTIPASVFASQAPYPGQFKTGRLHVTVTQGGVSGSFGGAVYFGYPQVTAA